MKKERLILYADLEAYSVKYYKLHNKIKAYALLAKSADKTINIFDVDTETWINKLFELKQNLVIYFHNGGGYDLRFIMDVLKRDFADYKTTYVMESNKRILKLKVSRKMSVPTGETKIKSDKRKKTETIHQITKQQVISIEFRDSLRLWPFPLKMIGDSVKMPKLEYGDYDILTEFTNESYIYSKEGYTDDFIYLNRDVDILIEWAEKTKSIVDIKDYKLTIGSTAVKKLYEINPILSFQIKNFLSIPNWELYKKGYRGGFTYLNPTQALKMLTNVYVYDINSMYPAIMMKYKFPFGKVYLDERGSFKFYRVTIKIATCKVFPFIEKDKSVKEFIYPKVLKNCVKYMSNYLLEHFTKWYSGEWEIKFLCSQQERYGMFDKYVNIFKDGKQNSFGAERELNKLFLNTPYGKMCEDILKNNGVIFTKDEFDEIPETSKIRNKKGNVYAYYDETGISYHIHNAGNLIYTQKSGEYVGKMRMSPISIGIKITELARIQISTAIIENWNNFIYCDTDSIHLTKPATNIEIDKSEFGMWKFEGLWNQAIYRRSKHYFIYNSDDDYKLKGGGFNVTKFGPDKKDDFKITLERYIQEKFSVKNGKLQSGIVDGGTLLNAIPYKFNMPDGWKNDK